MQNSILLAVFWHTHQSGTAEFNFALLCELKNVVPATVLILCKFKVLLSY